MLLIKSVFDVFLLLANYNVKCHYRIFLTIRMVYLKIFEMKSNSIHAPIYNVVLYRECNCILMYISFHSHAMRMCVRIHKSIVCNLRVTQRINTFRAETLLPFMSLASNINFKVIFTCTAKSHDISR